jgi:hypothetical protein
MLLVLSHREIFGGHKHYLERDDPRSLEVVENI